MNNPTNEYDSAVEERDRLVSELLDQEYAKKLRFIDEIASILGIADIDNSDLEYVAQVRRVAALGELRKILGFLCQNTTNEMTEALQHKTCVRPLAEDAVLVAVTGRPPAAPCGQVKLVFPTTKYADSLFDVEMPQVYEYAEEPDRTVSRVLTVVEAGSKLVAALPEMIMMSQDLSNEKAKLLKINNDYAQGILETLEAME